jgi:hypothetical protein
MAVATYTSTVFKNNQPKFNHTGTSAVRGNVKWTAAGTVGDIMFLAKVPHGAKIMDFYEFHTNGQTAVGLSFGFDRGVAAGGGANASCLISSGAVATMNRMSLAQSPNTGKAPIQISLSDLDTVRYARLICKAESGTLTISTLVNFGLTYYMDGPDPQ